ncbi:Hypothetical predicted protein, partial [Marmota monax]
VLANVLSKESEIPWPSVRYLIGEVIYGSRVTDIWDKRCLKTLLYKFCNPEVLKDDFSFSSDASYKSNLPITLLNTTLQRKRMEKKQSMKSENLEL